MNLKITRHGTSLFHEGAQQTVCLPLGYATQKVSDTLPGCTQVTITDQMDRSGVVISVWQNKNTKDLHCTTTLEGIPLQQPKSFATTEEAAFLAHLQAMLVRSFNPIPVAAGTLASTARAQRP